MRRRLPRTVVRARAALPLPTRRLRRGSTSDSMHNAAVMRWDSVAMGVVNTASTYLPVLVARLGGSAFGIGLLTAIPAVAGFALAIPIGHFLQRRGNAVVWYSVARLVANLSYVLIAVTVVFAPRHLAVPLIIAIWAVAAVPSTMGMVLFPIVMDGAAGPHGRLELMSRRWSYMGLTTAIAVSIIGQFLDRIPFPLGYAIVFASVTMAGAVSYYFSRQFRVPPPETPVVTEPRGSLGERIRMAVGLIRAQSAFLHYSVRQLVYVSGTRLVMPLIPLYYVTVVRAPDAWIGIIATGQSLALLAGYQFWRRQSRLRGTRILLLIAMLAASLYPAALSLTDQLIAVAALTTVASFFVAGVDLILFDELMRTVPRAYGVTFAAIDTTLVNMATVVTPLAGAAIAGFLGIELALRFGALVSLAGVVLFVQAARRRASEAPTSGSAPAVPASPAPPPPAPAAPPAATPAATPAPAAPSGPTRPTPSRSPTPPAADVPPAAPTEKSPRPNRRSG
jgi:hypothetical protein